MHLMSTEIVITSLLCNVQVPQLILDRLPRLPKTAGDASNEQRDQALLMLTVAGAILHLLSQPQQLAAKLRPHEVSAIPILSKRAGVKVRQQSAFPLSLKWCAELLAAN